MAENDTTPRDYIKALRAECKATLKRGGQIDFYDALATSRPTGEQAVFWLLPALREAQAERVHLRAACQAAAALIDRLENEWMHTTEEGQLLRAALAEVDQP